MFSLQIIFFIIFLNICFAAIFKNRGGNNVELQKKDATKQQLKNNDNLSSFNTCIDTAGIKRNNGDDWVASDYFVMLCHKVTSNETTWPIMRIEIVACLREDKKTRISIGTQVEEYPGKFLVCRRDNPNDLTGIVHREWRYVPLPKSFEEANTCLDSEGKRRQNGEEWIVATYFVMLCHQVLSNQSSWLIMQVEIVACLREDLKTRIPVGSEVEETPGRFLVCKRNGPDPTGIVWREWRIDETKKPVDVDKTCLDSNGNRRQNGEEWIVSDYFVFICHQVISSSLSIMQAEIVACLRDDKITRIPVGSEVEEYPGKFLGCRKVDPNDPTIMVRREWRVVVNPQPVQNIVKTCLDNEGKTRKDGEEWIVGDYFVFLCHQIPSNPVPIMVAQVVACLREDRQSRIAVGAEVEESPGMILSCKRADPNDPNGSVRREWHVAQSRNSTSPSSTNISNSSNEMKNWCFDKKIDTQLNHQNFVFLCSSPDAIPKLVACLPPQLNGAKINFNENVKLGSFKISCNQLNDGTMFYQYS
ncbi:hypothetical protein ACQ4LE_004843 [Meloidogyne hapla]|uniref:Abnormal cell migration protein 18-like fibronectin type I domain-containing protein n=1 Tax=Meloidogyne hapla TaxID=6305 RepID=A0A1I8BIX2_MELHA